MNLEITESRGGEIINVTDIDFAAVLAYLVFRQIPPKEEMGESVKKKPRKRKNLTEFRFEAEHPDRAHKIDEVWAGYINDDLSCAPRRLLAESRNLRNLTHHRTIRSRV